jgi:hypothetical protein
MPSIFFDRAGNPVPEDEAVDPRTGVIKDGYGQRLSMRDSAGSPAAALRFILTDGDVQITDGQATLPGCIGRAFAFLPTMLPCGRVMLLI